MVRAFSLTSESLAYFIGFALLHSKRVIIVSPWLSNVSLKLPLNNRFDDDEVSLITALTELPEIEVDLVVRTGESHNDYIKNKLPDHVSLHQADNLHAKAVVCDEFVYMGSANITRGGLTLNRELCEVLENEYRSADAYVKEKLDIDVSL